MSTGTEDFLSSGKNVVAESLREYRMRSNMSQKELAQASGLTQATISEIETGRGNPSLEVILRLAEALAIPPSALIGAGVYLGAIGATVAAKVAAKSLWDVMSGLHERVTDPKAREWLVTEFLERAKSSLAKVEARVNTSREKNEDRKDI
jgi:transcriptional regulator with XRE-family HTH domain